MAEKYKNYDFLIEESVSDIFLNVYQSIQINAKNYDNSCIELYSINGGGGFSLYLNDRFFYFNIDSETKRISSFYGDLLLKKIKYRNIEYPDSFKKGILVLKTEDSLLNGSGNYIQFNDKEIIYDINKKILCIGNINKNVELYKIFDNCYIQLIEKKLKGILISNITL